jgi:hypothetical protein
MTASAGHASLERRVHSPAYFFQSPKIFVEICQPFSFDGLDLLLDLRQPAFDAFFLGFKLQEAENQISSITRS